MSTFAADTSLMPRYTNVLLVDDDIDDIELFIDCLFAIDSNIICNIAHNGVEALALFNTNKPDFILTDQNMPVMDGKTLIQELLRKATDIPIVLMSTSRNAIVEALTIGASDAFVKPHSIAELQGILRKFFS